MNSKRITFHYCALFTALMLFSFSGIWHPLLHDGCTDDGQPFHADCPLCLGLMHSEPPQEIRLPDAYGKPVQPNPYRPAIPDISVPRTHTPRAPPHSF